MTFCNPKMPAITTKSSDYEITKEIMLLFQHYKNDTIPQKTNGEINEQ